MRPATVAVGFDLDYTLWDQDGFLDSFFQEAGAALGARFSLDPARVTGAFRSALARLTPHHPRLLGAALEELGLAGPDLERELVRRYRMHRPPVRAYPETGPLLAWLKASGYRLFLVTDGNLDVQRYKVAALGLEPWFEVIVFTAELGAGQAKPSPLPFLVACTRLGVPPVSCVYVGDDPDRDFQGARRLGLRTVGVGTGPFATLAAPPGQAPDHRIDSLDQLRGLL